MNKKELDKTIKTAQSEIDRQQEIIEKAGALKEAIAPKIVRTRGDPVVELN